MKRRLSASWRVIRLVLIAYLGVLLIHMLFEDRLIYFPSAYPAGDWNPPGLEFEDAWFDSRDGCKLHGWFVPHENPQATVLFAHGNAGNLSDRAEILRVLHQIGVSVLIFDYRGYGRSEGKPTETGVFADARAARAWLAKRTEKPEKDIVLLGRSLGGAVMVDLAAIDGARGLILESTFSSLPDVAAHHYSMLPVHSIMHTRFDSAAKIKDYHGPLLQSHGTHDGIIPLELGKKLHEAANEPKEFFIIEGLGHNDFAPSEYYQKLRQFLETLK